MPWLETYWQRLNEYQKINRIPQALLISGSRGIGKSALARQFAFALLCTKPDTTGKHCGQCRYCQLLAVGSHPDFIEIVPEEDKKTISINQIRNLVSNIYLKPQFDRYRVILINPADLLTLSAANAFLKCLEEPTERTVFLLITDKPYKLPATITSRCQRIILNKPNPESIQQWLKKSGVDDDRNYLAALLKGSLLTPEQLTDVEILKHRQACFNDWLLVAEKKISPVLVAEKWDKVPKNELVDWLISWVSDTIKCLFKVDIGFSYNLDFNKSLQKNSQQLELSCLYKLYDHLLNCRELMGMQVNYQVMLEEILVRWQEINRRKLYG